MNERTLRPGNLAAAAVVIGGLLVLAFPQHGMSIVRLVIVTIAAGAGLYAHALNAPATWWASPFDRRRRGRGKAYGSAEIDWIRSTLSGRRQRTPTPRDMRPHPTRQGSRGGPGRAGTPVENGPALPPETLRLLQPLIRVALERQGIDADDGAHREAARTLLSTRTWAVLQSDPLSWPPRFRTLRPDKRKTADAVHAILDELDRLGASMVAVATTPRHQAHLPASPRWGEEYKDTSRQVSP